MSGDFMSVIQDRIPEAIPGQACYMTTCPIRSGYDIYIFIGKRDYSSVYCSNWPP
jgi:hypothetical protein